MSSRCYIELSAARSPVLRPFIFFLILEFSLVIYYASVKGWRYLQTLISRGPSVNDLVKSEAFSVQLPKKKKVFNGFISLVL